MVEKNNESIVILDLTTETNLSVNLGKIVRKTFAELPVHAKFNEGPGPSPYGVPAGPKELEKKMAESM